MAGSYLKKARESIIKHPSWRTYSEQYELSLAKHLHNRPETIQAAQKALYRMSKVLTSYYGPDNNPAPLPEPEMNLALQNIETMANGNASETGVEPDTNSAVPDENDGGQIAPNTQEPEEKRAIPVNATLINSYLNTSKNSAGQIGISDDMDVNAEKLNSVLNEDGNLREKMTAMYNGVLINSNSPNSRSLKGVALSADKRSAERLGLNYGAIKKDRRNRMGSDILHVTNIARGYNKKPGRLISFMRAIFSRKDYSAENQGPGPTLGADFYSNNGMELSQRESDHALSGQDLGWREGMSYSHVDENSSWTKKRRSRGFRLITGPSGTTARMLAAYRWLGATHQELLDFRLALAGWMLSGDHSLYEIILGSKVAGVRGKEDTTDAISLYQTVDPLDNDYLRQNAAVDNQFPHEHVYREMLENSTAPEALTALEKEARVGNNKFSADQHAIYAYTTELYRLMNPGMVAGNKVSNMFVDSLPVVTSAEVENLNLMNYDQLVQHYDERIWELTGFIENETDDDRKRLLEHQLSRVQADLQALEDRFAVLQARVTPEGKEKRKADRKELARTSSLIMKERMPFMQKETGTVFRATWMSSVNSAFSKRGASVDFGFFTSTTRNVSKTDAFYNNNKFTGIKGKFLKPILLEIDLRGFSGVDVAQMSDLEDEEEVLLMPGAKLKVTSPVSKSGDKNVAVLEEVGNPNNRATSAPAQQLALPEPQPPVNGGDALMGTMVGIPIVDPDDDLDIDDPANVPSTVALGDANAQQLNGNQESELNEIYYLIDEILKQNIDLAAENELEEPYLDDIEAIAYVVQKLYGDAVFTKVLDKVDYGEAVWELEIAVLEVLRDYDISLETAREKQLKPAPLSGNVGV